MRTLVLHPAHRDLSRRPPEDALAEIVSLAAALDLDIVRADIVTLPGIRAGTLFGTGKLDDLRAVIADEEIGLAIVDGTLTPVQQRNLERAWSCKVLDRTGLILEIFGERAQTREGVLQVELAHLNYQKSRLVRSWTHLERQRGGVGFLGGPGETQIEADRRALEERIGRIRRALDKVVRTRSQHRAARARSEHPVVALVGYTNAGKSTLFNRMTGAEVMARDMLFATLDPTMRAVDLPGGQRIILSDTVGFISDLPTMLVAAFRATLEEVVAADVIVHMRDISHPETEHQAENVREILADIGVGEDRQDDIIEVWNKIDQVAPEDLAALEASAARRPNTVLASARSGSGIEALNARIEAALASATEHETLTVPFGDGRRRAWLFEHNVVEEERATREGYRIDVRWTPRERSLYRRL